MLKDVGIVPPFLIARMGDWKNEVHVRVVGEDGKPSLWWTLHLQQTPTVCFVEKSPVLSSLYFAARQVVLCCCSSIVEGGTEKETFTQEFWWKHQYIYKTEAMATSIQQPAERLAKRH